MANNEQAKEWAKEKALSEEEAFDYAIRANNIKHIIAENAELRDTIKQQAEQISRLREALLRGSEEHWD